MSAYSFVILLPNARRQTVQATQDTSLLQILEQACTKHGFNPVEWDLQHFNKTVDVGNVVRFSGLPNNATLEMVPCTKPRKESLVNVGLQLESGKRLTHQFTPQDSIWTIFQHWQEKGDLEIPTDPNVGLACIYMRQDIVGEENQKAKTLKSLGVIQGSVVLRVVKRQLDQEIQQANVSSVLKRPPPEVEATSSKQRPNSQSATKLKPLPMPSSPTMEVDVEEKPVAAMKDDSVQGEQILEPKTADVPIVPEGNLRDSERLDEPQVVQMQDKVDLHVPRGTLKSLGPEGAYLYHADDVNIHPSELTDDFFDVTLDDVKAMYRELQTKRRGLEEMPLQLKTVKEEEHEHWRKVCLETHPITVVRIRFPDRTVLQGTFKSSDDFAVVYNFVRQFLQSGSLEFYLFTTPPRKVHAEPTRMVDEGLFGLAVMYFGSSASSDASNYLKPDLPLSDPHQVFQATSQLVRNNSASAPNFVDGGIKTESIGTPSSSTSGSTPSTSQQHQAPKPKPKVSNAATSGAVPKWFKK